MGAGLARAARRLRFPRAIRPVAAQLQQARTRLHDLAEDVERRFLACGDALGQQAMLARKVAAENARLQDFDDRVSRREAALARMATAAEEKLRLGDQFGRRIEDLATTLDRYDERLRRLLQHQATLEGTFAPLAVLRSLFRIESATLPSDLRAHFDAVTIEMARLAEVSRQTLAAQSAALADTRQRIRQMAARLRTRARLQAEAIAKTRGAVESVLHHVDAELTTARQRNAELGRRAAEIDREIGSATVALQYQDITRQKMAHVDAAIDDLLRDLREPGTAPFGARVRRHHVLCDLQAMQAAAIAAELRTAAAGTRAALEAILAALQAIEAEGMSQEDVADIIRVTDAAITETPEASRLAAAAITAALGGLRESIEATRGLRARTTEATETIGRLAFEIRLMGLNAEIQAVQVRSAGLEVLSGAAARVSTEALAATRVLEADLAHAGAELERIVDASEQFHHEIDSALAGLQARDEQLRPGIAAEHRENRAALQQMAELLRQLRTSADSLLESLSLTESAPVALEHLEHALKAFGAVCASAHAPVAADDPATSLTTLEKRYTMESERTVHAHAVAVSTGAAANPTEVTAAIAVPADALAATPAASELGANVELF